MPQVVVVLGMDRSGTSLCTSILSALGIQLGPNLAPGDQYNATGFFEEWEIFRVNERALRLLGRTWNTIDALQPLPHAWWRAPQFQSVIEEMVGIARGRSGIEGKVWGFKDPRTATLYPLWRETFRVCDLQPTYVVCLRNPAAVAASLAEREGFVPLFSELLWLEKTIAACAVAAAGPNCIIRYEDWFTCPAGQCRILADAVGIHAQNPFTPEVEAKIRKDLRHDGERPLEIQSRAAKQLYELLGDKRSVPGLPVLEPFRAMLQTAREFVSVGETLWRKNQIALEQQLTERSSQAEALSTSVEGLTRELAARDTTISDLQALTRDLVTQNNAIVDLQKRVAEQLLRANQLTAEIARRDQIIADSKLEEQRLSRELNAHDFAIGELRGELTQALCKYENLAAQLAAGEDLLHDVSKGVREFTINSQDWIQRQRRDKTWQLMLTLRKAHWLLLGKGWSGRAQFVRWLLWDFPAGKAALQTHEPLPPSLSEFLPEQVEKYSRRVVLPWYRPDSSRCRR